MYQNNQHLATSDTPSISNFNVVMVICKTVFNMECQAANIILYIWLVQIKWYTVIHRASRCVILQCEKTSQRKWHNTKHGALIILLRAILTLSRILHQSFTIGGQMQAVNELEPHFKNNSVSVV